MTSTKTFQLGTGTLRLDAFLLLSGLPDTVSIQPDPLGVGAFLHFTAPKQGARHLFSLGNLEGVRRFTACHRYEPFWMRAKAGTRGGEVPVETQFLLAELENGNCVLLAPLVDGHFRSSLQGREETGLELVAETGDPAILGMALTGLFIAAAEEPYGLLEAGAKSVNAFTGAGRLRRDKALPEFVDRFGWCTWDAFYQDVSHDRVREGLESFKTGGVAPKYLILDDGWQSVRQMPTGEKRLIAFQANEKFPGDLAPTVSMAKQTYGIETFLVWHAFQGYWGGVDGEALPGYDVHAIARAFSPGIYAHVPPTFDDWWGPVVGVVSPEKIYRFYQDYHRHLRKQGVDGVKVDNQAAEEGLAAGLGGRVPMMQRYHEALEGSAQTHFKGNLINCMSCSSEMLYGALNSNLTRTSTDFWPKLPESHGQHLYINAQVSLWFGEFIHPDWDMFQSGHPMGAFHAAGRAVGGCPVYVSDKPGAHNFDLLRKLVLPDGGILRAAYPGRPTRDCLFYDPTREDVLLKIFNLNENHSGLVSGIVGVFHAKYEKAAEGQEEASLEAAEAASHGTEDPLPSPNAKTGPEAPRTHPISGSVSPSDVEGLPGSHFAVYAHYARELRLMNREQRWEITLDPLTAEVFTIAPALLDFAAVGIVDMFNSAGAVEDVFSYDPETEIEVSLCCGGRFVAWSKRRPVEVELNGKPQGFSYQDSNRMLVVEVPNTPDLREYLLLILFAEEAEE